MQVCPHIKHDTAEAKEKFGNKEDDGRYFVITEYCRDCFSPLLLSAIFSSPEEIAVVKLWEDKPPEKLSDILDYLQDKNE